MGRRSGGAVRRRFHVVTETSATPEVQAFWNLAPAFEVRSASGEVLHTLVDDTTVDDSTMAARRPGWFRTVSGDTPVVAGGAAVRRSGGGDRIGARGRSLGTHTGWRVLGTFAHAVLIRRFLLEATRVAHLSCDHDIGVSTAYRHVHEALDVLAAQAPGCARRCRLRTPSGTPTGTSSPTSRKVPQAR